jgi:alpha-tubulin suppressor-like RCC1 family protein
MHDLPNSEKGNNIIEVKCGRFHNLAVSKRGQVYSWGEGSNCRLGLGFIEKTHSTPSQLTPYQIENVFDSNKIVTVGCGEFISGLSMQSGTVYTWGKGEHEKPKFNDYLEYSSPFVILEEKQIQHLSFGRSHVMALDRFGKLYAWGDGGFGCLGFGDNKRRATP